MMMTMMINNEQQQHEQSDEAVRAELLRTLEYYFSSKNLSKDEYLVSQMDDECYVSLDEIAKFNKIRTLTSDKRFIRHIIGQSDQLELDAATGNKVRSVNGRLGGACGPKAAPSTGHQRSVLILREVSPQATAEHIQSLFADKEPLCAACDKCESAGNQSWYVTFSNEEQAQRALQYLKTEVQVFMDRAIKARIKAHAAPRSTAAAFLPLTPTSTPPPPPPPAVYPQLVVPPAPAYDLPVYPPAASWPIQNALFLLDINQPFQEHDHRADANATKFNMIMAKQYGLPINHYSATHHHYMAQQAHSPFYAPLFDEPKTMPLPPATAPPLAYFYNQLGSTPAGLHHHHQMHTSSTSSSSSSPRLSQQQHQQFRPRAAEVKVGAPAQTVAKHGKGKPSEPDGLNSESSFPPLNPACARNITISLRTLADEHGSDVAPNDPAIISCYKSADCIPDSPTIIKSNSVIDSTSHESKKATSETLANILNHELKPDYKSAPHYHHRHKHESYQPRHRANRQQPVQRKNDQARYVRGTNPSANSHRQVVMMADESCAASDDDALAACWAKKLTFAEIVQKSASPSPMSANDYTESSDADFVTSPHSIAAE